ncbi:hydroxymethylglutaryl-CoA lyase [Pseudomonas kurunegalensis]|uniref:hydroxymethylglutaryl-CoA lyase n=1 Tax=Pseudomonas kurunegalensis TaxID=485880 RepID=UPI003558E46B
MSMVPMQAVKVFEVGPRDGLQNERQPLSVAARVGLIGELAGTGLRHIEAGAFVSPRWVPQMAGSDEVLRQLPSNDGVSYTALVPNRQGFEAAQRAGCREVAVFAAASEAFSRNNINCSIDESFERFTPVLRAAKEASIRVRGYVSCVLGCPFNGAVEPEAVAKVARRLYELGCYEISLGDTIGAGRPDETAQLFELCARQLPVAALAGHFHDTWGMAIANVHAALAQGVSTFDSSVAGLGGCPYSPGASGNVATEDLLYLLHGLGYSTGVDLEAVARVGVRISAQLGTANRSRAGLALAARSAREH